MKKILYFVLFSLSFSCHKGEDPRPINNPYLNITAKDFIGTWIYKVDGKDYTKIVVKEGVDGLHFQHSYNYANVWEIDTDEYYPQDGVKFYPYLTTTINDKPHLIIKSFYGTSRIDYVSDSRGTHLHMDVTGRYFKENVK